MYIYIDEFLSLAAFSWNLLGITSFGLSLRLLKGWEAKERAKKEEASWLADYFNGQLGLIHGTLSRGCFLSISVGSVRTSGGDGIGQPLPPWMKKGGKKGLAGGGQRWLGTQTEMEVLKW